MRLGRLIISAVMVAAALALAGCSSHKSVRTSSKLDPFAGTGSPYYKGSGPIPKGGGRYHVGSPYQVAGRWFTPREQPGYDKKGVASWYGEAFHRRKTSNGEYFDMDTLTAAHATLPLPSYAKVTNLANGKSVIVRINDRGPFVDTRLIDLSKRAAQVLGYQRQGKTKVRVQWIGMAPLNDQGSHLAMMNREMMKGANITALAMVSEGKLKPRSMMASADPAPAPAPAPAAEEQQPIVQASYAEQPQATPAVRPAAYLINVAMFSNPDNAEAAQDQLSSYGPVQIFESQRDDGTVYRVQMGPFSSAIAAKEALSAAQEAGFGDARLMKAQIRQTSAQPD